MGNQTNMESKEEQVLEPFFNSPKHWHFDELLEKAGISRSQLVQWLKKFVKNRLIKRIKPKGRMPYYIGNYTSLRFKNLKRIFALDKLCESGLLDHLGSLQKAKTIIIFGSFSRSDWYKNSDVDIFIYGDPKGLKIVDYELKLHRDIQLFTARDKKDLKKMGSGLIQNILEGYFVKGKFGQLGIKLSI